MARRSSPTPKGMATDHVDPSRGPASENQGSPPAREVVTATLDDPRLAETLARHGITAREDRPEDTPGRFPDYDVSWRDTPVAELTARQTAELREIIDRWECSVITHHTAMTSIRKLIGGNSTDLRNRIHAR